MVEGQRHECCPRPGYVLYLFLIQILSYGIVWLPADGVLFVRLQHHDNVPFRKRDSGCCGGRVSPFKFSSSSIQQCETPDNQLQNDRLQTHRRSVATRLEESNLDGYAGS
jgi:hypothetical protein